MSEGSAELPQTAIRRIMSTVETIQTIFPDLWIDKDDDKPQESTASGTTTTNKSKSIWEYSVKPYPEVSADVSWPSSTTKEDIKPENPNAAISRLISVAETNKLLFPELWNPAESVEQDFSGDMFQLSTGSPGIWSYDRHKQNQLSKNEENNPESLVRREREDSSEDEDASDDSGVCSGTYSA